MYVGMAKITLVIGHAHSLKEKRMVIRRIRDRVRERMSVTVSEVGEQGVWQRAELGCAVTSGERAKALEVLDEVVRCIAAAGGGDVIGVAKDVVTFDAVPAPIEITIDDDRAGSGDKTAGATDWIPEAWKTE